MSLTLISALWIFSLVFTALAAYTFGWEKKADDGVWCKAGTHFFATWKPCPCCMKSMIDEYKKAKSK